MPEASKWKATAEHAQTNKRQMTHCLQTQLIEDMIATQKNSPSTMALNRYKRPQSCMMATLASNVVTERHHFTSVTADIPLPKRTKLESHYFEADKTLESLPFGDVANSEAKASFYSPKSENNNVIGRLNGDHTQVTFF